MRKVVFLLLLSAITSLTYGQGPTAPKSKLYDPKADAKADIRVAVERARKEGKHVMLQVGGNWCGWCIAFEEKVMHNDTLKVALEKNYIYYHLNFSQENMNKDVLASLGYPQRFGFPVFVVLDGQGNRIHTENSAYLEEGKGHSTKKVLEFFEQWSPSALDPEKYR